MTHRLLRPLFLTVLATALVACGADAASTDVASPEPAAAPAASAPPDGPSAPAAAASPPAVDGPATLAVADDPELGPLLVDDDGLSLYVFFEDSEGQSTCTDACADNWPPVLTDGAPEIGADGDPQLLATTARDDGSQQVTYDGQPLYRYSGDSAPGDLLGLGIGNVWYPVAPDGAPLDVSEDVPADDGY